MALINCKECGKEFSDSAEFCPHCGYNYKYAIEQNNESSLQQQTQPIIEPPKQVISQPIVQSTIQEQQIYNQGYANIQQPNQTSFDTNKQSFVPKNIFKNKTVIWSVLIVILAFIVGVLVATKTFNKSNEEQKAIRVNISMTSYYGYIDDILDELGLDFELVTAGANCYSGVVKSEFKTEKYGILHTEFRYCKSNETQVFRVYNSETEQPLRDPKSGELSRFDKYGEKIDSYYNKL